MQENTRDRDHRTKEMLVVVGSRFAQHLPTTRSNTQQHATTRATTRSNMLKGVQTDATSQTELFGPTLLRPFKRGLRAAEKHEGRICLKRGYFMQDNHHSISLDERISIS